MRCCGSGGHWDFRMWTSQVLHSLRYWVDNSEQKCMIHRISACAPTFCVACLEQKPLSTGAAREAELKDNKEAENEDCDVSKLFFFFLKL